MDKNKAIEILKELKELSQNYVSVEMTELDSEALEYAIKTLEKND